MRNHIRHLLLAIVIAFSLAVIPMSAWGDAGGYSGSTDYGGGGSYGGSSSSGGYDDYSDSSYGSSSTGTTSSDDYSGSDCLVTIIDLLIACAIIFVIYKVKSKSSKNKRMEVNVQRACDLKSIDELVTQDPSFDSEQMQKEISDLYIQMQHAWQSKDFSPMRAHFTDALYNQFDRQLDALRNDNQTNHVDDIIVQSVVLDGWYIADDNQCLVATVQARIVDYTTDDKTGDIVSGSDSATKLMTYEYTLTRSAGGTQADQADEGEETTCPHCGGVVEINQSAVCPYCGCVLTSKEFDWAISQIKGISQETL